MWVSEEHFRIIYEGSAVEDGEMEVGQLAPSLLALGKLLEAVDSAVSGEAGRVRVKVRADVRRGSFDIGISLDFIHSVKAWLISPDGQALSALASITGLGVVPGSLGLIQAVRWLKGRKPSTKIVLSDGNVRIETADGESIEVTSPVAGLVESAAVRQQLERFTEPLRGEGIEAIRSEGAGGSERIVAEEAASFQATAVSDPTSQARFQATYQIKRLYFERGKKWRLSSGAQTILAGIEDDAFWNRVERSEVAFSADDYLVCEVRMDQWLGATGLRTEYTVERVLDHLPTAKQDRLPGT